MALSATAVLGIVGCHEVHDLLLLFGTVAHALLVLGSLDGLDDGLRGRSRSGFGGWRRLGGRRGFLRLRSAIGLDPRGDGQRGDLEFLRCGALATTSFGGVILRDEIDDFFLLGVAVADARASCFFVLVLMTFRKLPPHDWPASQISRGIWSKTVKFATDMKYGLPPKRADDPPINMMLEQPAHCDHPCHGKVSRRGPWSGSCDQATRIRRGRAVRADSEEASLPS